MCAGAFDQRDRGAAAPPEAVAEPGDQFETRRAAADHDDAVERRGAPLRRRLARRLTVDDIRHWFHRRSLDEGAQRRNPGRPSTFRRTSIPPGAAPGGQGPSTADAPPRQTAPWTRRASR